MKKSFMRKLKYRLYHSLSLLGIVKRVTDEEETSIYCSPQGNYEGVFVITHLIKARVNLSIKRIHKVEVDYFKRGNKILYVNRSLSKDSYYLVGTLKNIYVTIEREVISIDDLKDSRIVVFSKSISKDFGAKVVEYNFEKLRALKCVCELKNLDNGAEERSLVEVIRRGFLEYIEETPIEELIPKRKLQ